jgi:ABC-type bacteriocin/lantibiotic exporter with double-glycine peptidase domain
VPKRLLPIPHRKQQGDGDCLAACAAMILESLDAALPYADVLRLLKVKSFGAPASNIRLLEQLSLRVSYRVTNMAGLEQLLTANQPVIVFVRTYELPYWVYATDHALVVVGFDDAHIFVNDPYFDNAPIAVTRGDFELAWLERDYYYATITR